jgi:hypothetical protein
MTIHVPPGLWLGTGAAVMIVIGSVALAVQRAAPQTPRVRVVTYLMAWLAADVALGAVGAFAATPHRPVPGIVVGIALPLIGGLWLLRRPNGLSRVVDSVPTPWLIGVQVYRVAGVVFILAWLDGLIPGVFALPAGLGDLAVGLSAPFVAARVGDGTARSRRIAVIWNIAGITDLVMAVTLGALTSSTPLWPVAFGRPNPLISRLPFVLIPVFAVPLSVLLHFVTLRRLHAGSRAVDYLRRSFRSASAVAASAGTVNSIESSELVTSTAVPKVATVAKNDSSVP